MNENRLRIYLEDHLALMVGELQLIDRCRDANPTGSLGQFLGQLRTRTAEQKAVADTALRQLGHPGGLSSSLKQGTAWFLEKMGRFKPNDSLSEYSDLSRVVELESLLAAAQERIAMWRSLQTVATADSRLDNLPLADLCDQSQQHLGELMAHLDQAAKTAFLNAPATDPK